MAVGSFDDDPNSHSVARGKEMENSPGVSGRDYPISSVVIRGVLMGAPVHIEMGGVCKRKP